jgi:carbon starvation protein CstA
MSAKLMVFENQMLQGCARLAAEKWLAEKSNRRSVRVIFLPRIFLLSAAEKWLAEKSNRRNVWVIFLPHIFLLAAGRM